MNRRRTHAVLAGVAASLALMGGIAPAAQAETLQRQLLCDGAEPNALTKNLPLLGTGCENGVYDPETEQYAPYDPATEPKGLLGLDNALGVL